MTDRQPIETKNLDRYGNAALPWSRAEAALADSSGADITWFLGTSDPDGASHGAGVGALWFEGELFFTSGPDTRKSRNLASTPRASIGVRLRGIDVVFEGPVARVADHPTLEAVASRYRDGGWPAQVDGEALTAPFSAPSAGPPPWNVYRLDFDVVFGVATEDPQGATRWRF